MELTPREKLELISPSGVAGTPLEIMHSALIQHFKDDEENFNKLHDLLVEISAKLTPISDTYTTVSRMGKWGMAGLVAMSMMVGMIYTMVQILMAYKQH